MFLSHSMIRCWCSDISCWAHQKHFLTFNISFFGSVASLHTADLFPSHLLFGPFLATYEPAALYSFSGLCVLVQNVFPRLLHYFCNHAYAALGLHDQMFIVSFRNLSFLFSQQQPKNTLKTCASITGLCIYTILLPYSRIFHFLIAF